MSLFNLYPSKKLVEHNNYNTFVIVDIIFVY